MGIKLPKKTIIATLLFKILSYCIYLEHQRNLCAKLQVHTVGRLRELAMNESASQRYLAFIDTDLNQQKIRGLILP